MRGKHNPARLSRSKEEWAVVRMKFTPEEADEFEAAADRAGMPVVDYLYWALRKQAKETEAT
jgi:hypothetical protein